MPSSMDNTDTKFDKIVGTLKSARFLNVVWLLVVFLTLGYFKIRYALAQKNFAIDGGFYTDVARHIRDGLGVSTNVSLYHQAYSYFPHESSVSPLWPLLYGYTSRIFDMFAVGIWLPTVLYFTALLTVYLWANRLFPRQLFPDHLPGFRLGHVFALMIGLHREFFLFTSMPYTEGLAFTLLGLALWRMHKVLQTPNLRNGVEIGLWLSVLFLARAQFFLVAIAIFMTLVWGVLFTADRKKSALNLVGCALAFGIPIGAYYFLFIATFVEAPAHLALLRFDQGFETPMLSGFDPMVNTKGLWATLTDRFSGVSVAYSLRGRFAYARSFYIFQYGTLIAPFALLAFGIRERKNWKQGWAFLRSSAALPWIMIVLFSMGAFVSMHLIHKDYFSEWHFARRQGVTSIFIFFLALVFLLRKKGVAAAIAIFLICGGIYLGFNLISKDTTKAEKSKQVHPKNYRKALAKWLNEKGKITVALSAHTPQKIAAITPNVGYHWVYSRTTAKDLEHIMTDLGAKYLILERNTNKWNFKRDKTFNERYQKVTRVAGAQIYERK